MSLLARTGYCTALIIVILLINTLYIAPAASTVNPDPVTDPIAETTETRADEINEQRRSLSVPNRSRAVERPALQIAGRE